MSNPIKAVLKGIALSMIAVAIFVCAQVSAHAAIIVLSQGTATDAGETNSTGNPTITIAPNPGWAAALPGSSWVSYAITGNPAAPGFIEVANGTTVTFNQTFIIPVGEFATGGSFTVRADDSTSVILNGNVLILEAPTNAYTTCSDIAIGCLQSTQRTFTFAEFGGFLNAPGATNVLSFTVAQRDGVSFGLNYGGTIATQTGQTPVPEPATMLLIGTGLVGIAGAARRRAARK